jgi:glycosyltransferase involved in cell wall biosynthesis
MLRIGVITAIPTPYRDPFWNAVAAEPATELKVYYCASTNAERPWSASWQMKYDSEVLPGVNVLAQLGMKGFSYWNPDITARLTAGRHDALIIGGYNYPTMMAAIRFARRRGIPYFLMSESHLREPRAMWRRIIKQPIVRQVVRNAAGCFPTGTWARDYLLHYGASPDRLWFLPNVPDVEQLACTAQSFAPRRDELRRQFGLGDAPVVLYVGRLVEFKRVDLLIQAFAKLGDDSPARLVIVGDGVLRPKLEALAEQLGVAARAQFRGFVEPAEIPLWYAVGDVLVLPSVGETWSVAVLEALASGLPVITTDTVGAAADAIKNPSVGTIVPSADATALSQAISARLADGTDRDKVWAAWATARDGYRYDVLSRRFVEAIRHTIDEPGMTDAR